MSQYLPAKVIYVADSSSFICEVLTPTGRWVRRHYMLKNFDSSRFSRSKANSAQHCLVILIGGKRLMVDVGDNFRFSRGCEPVAVYSDFKVVPGANTMTLGSSAKPRIDIGSAMVLASESDFDTKVVLKLLNGEAKKHG